jgi:xylan 1,4-beta-xylosidase
MTLRFQGMRPKHARISTVDPAHGDIHAAYEKMGSPRYPTQAQIEQLKKASDLSAPEVRDLKNGELTLSLPSYGLALIEVK